MENFRPDITQATDHQSYLKELFVHLKSKNKFFSHGYCSKKLSVSLSYLKDIFSKRRALSLDLVDNLAVLFQLSSFEIKFLTVLVVKDQLTSGNTRLYFENVLSGLRFESIQMKNYPRVEASETNQKFLGDRLLHLLHSLVQLKDFRPDADWIKGCINHPGITNDQIIEGYKYLFGLGVLEEKDGKYLITGEFVHSPNPYDLETFKILRPGLREVDQALENVQLYKGCGFILAHLAVDGEGADRILDAFHKFRQDASEIEKDCSKPDRVIGISNNYLTLARSDKEKSS